MKLEYHNTLTGYRKGCRCEDCHLANSSYLKKYHQTHPLTRAQRTRRKELRLSRISKRKQKAIDLLGGKCVNCGSTENLQFDHIKRDRVDDKHVITHMVNDTTWKNVLEELAKCQLLCQTCHAQKSNAERGRTGIYNHGTANRYRILGCRCELCSGYHKAYMKEWHRKRKLAIV